MAAETLPVLEPLRQAAAATKCHRCGCFQDAVEALLASSKTSWDAELRSMRSLFEERRYDCLGCDVCWPSDALNQAAERIELPASVGCARDDVAPREGWPPLPGEYTVLDPLGSVAVCTLHSRELVEAIARAAPSGLSIVGAMQTENLGIERLLTNVISNPRLRTLILCGEDTGGSVGHFPGQTLLALKESGVDEQLRIRGARGKRPVLKNLSPTVIHQFRQQLELLDLRGCSEITLLSERIVSCAEASPPPYTGERAVPAAFDIVAAQLPTNVSLDPAGYVVVQLDRQRALLRAEHYGNDGTLLGVVEGARDDAVAFTLVERGWVTRADHAAYVGRELSRAAAALESGQPYVQDAAPEQPAPVTSCCGNGNCR